MRGRGLRAGAWSVAAVALLALSLPAQAHDLWIEPTRFTVDPGEPLGLTLRLGHPAGEVESMPRDDRRIERFVVAGADGERPVSGVDGIDPAGVVQLDRPGRYVVGYRSIDAVSELPAAKFEVYLVEEGLESIRRLRAERGEIGEPGRELFSRALKALITVGRPAPGPADRPLGLRLELVAEGDPAALGTGDRLSVRVLFEGRPLAGARVDAVSLDRPELASAARSDEAGRVDVELPTGGRWLLTAVHMVEAPAGSPQDWQSVWAASTFSAGTGDR